MREFNIISGQSPIVIKQRPVLWPRKLCTLSDIWCPSDKEDDGSHIATYILGAFKWGSYAKMLFYQLWT
jgi:hypothetical protein